MPFTKKMKCLQKVLVLRTIGQISSNGPCRTADVKMMTRLKKTSDHGGSRWWYEVGRDCLCEFLGMCVFISTVVFMLLCVAPCINLCGVLSFFLLFHNQAKEEEGRARMVNFTMRPSTRRQGHECSISPPGQVQKGQAKNEPSAKRPRHTHAT